MVATTILTGLKLTGMISGSYVGYRYGDCIKKWCCERSQRINDYHKEYVYYRFKKSQIRENTIFNMIGCFTGILGGYYIWPIFIPIMIYQIAEDYPDEFKKIKKFIKD